MQIEPIDYVDTWLPAFGVPLGFRGIGAGWRYDPNPLTAFSGQRQRAAPYTVQSLLPQPDTAMLRPSAAGPANDGGEFLDTGGVDPPGGGSLPGSPPAGSRLITTELPPDHH